MPAPGSLDMELTARDAAPVTSEPPTAEPARARRFWHLLLAVAAVGLLLRLLVVLLVPTRPASDPWSYYQRAQNLLRHGRYEALPGRLDASYPPAYPLALAAAIAIGPQAGALLRAKLLNCALGGASIVLVGLLARRLFGARTGLVAACLLAAYPRGLLQAPVLVSEHIFTPLLLLLVLLLALAWERERARPLAWLAGATVALLALTRPIAYPLGLLWLGRGLTGRSRWGTVVRELALLLAVQHLVMLPWAIRNLVSLGQLSFLSSVGGVDLFIGNNPRATGGWQPWREALNELEPSARGEGLSCFEVDTLARRAATGWIRSHPGQAVRLYLTKLGLILDREEYLPVFAITGTNLWPPFGGIDALPADHPAKRFARAVEHTLDWSSRLLLALAVGGLVVLLLRTFPRPGTAPAAAWLLPVAAAYFPAVAAVFHASSRYRWPAEDLSVVLAAVILAALVSRVGFRRACRAS